MLVFELHAYINDKLSQKRFELKSPKNDPLGKIGRKLFIKKTKHPNCKEFLNKIISFKFLKIKKKNIANKKIVPTIPCSERSSIYI